MKKKILALLLAGLMAFSAAACGGDTTSSTGGSGDTASTADGGDGAGDAGDAGDAGNAAIDTSEHVVVNYLTLGDIPTNQTDAAVVELNKMLTEKVNAEIAIRWIEWTDWATQYNLAMASQSGDLDLIVTATDWLDAWPNAQKGAFLALSEEMLQTYAPKTWEQVDALGHWEDCKLDGTIYFIPEDTYTQWINHGVMYREDWASEAGLDGVHSFEDLEVYFQWVKDNQPDCVPWDVAGSVTSGEAGFSGGWWSSYTDDINIDGFGVNIFRAESADDLTTISRYLIEGDEFVNFAKTMKEWSDAGYWREDVMNYKGDTREEFYSGLSGIDQHHTETYYTTVAPEMKKRTGVDVGFFFFGEETDNLVRTVTTHGAMAIGAQSQNPERALMVYDLMRFDQEVYDIMNYGFSDNFTVDEDNILTWADDYDSATEGVTFNFWAGRNDEMQHKNSTFAWEPYEALVEVYDEVAVEYPFGKFIPDKTQMPWLENLSAVANTYMPQIAFGKTDDPEALVAEFRQALKDAGYEEAIAEAERQLAEIYG